MVTVTLTSIEAAMLMTALTEERHRLLESHLRPAERRELTPGRKARIEALERLADKIPVRA